MCVKRVRVAVQWPRKKFQMLRNLSLLGNLCVCQWEKRSWEQKKTQTPQTLVPSSFNILDPIPNSLQMAQTLFLQHHQHDFDPSAQPVSPFLILFKCLSVPKSCDLPRNVFLLGRKGLWSNVNSDQHLKPSIQTIEMKHSADCEPLKVLLHLESLDSLGWAIAEKFALSQLQTN